MESATKQVTTVQSILTRVNAYYELTKPGITLMVLASMLVGFIVGSAGSFDYLIMIHAVIGTFLISSGTAAHNQFIERHLDKLMNRTSKRPIPSERIPAENASVFAITLIIAGFLYLLLMVNFVAGLVSAITTAMYLGIYTPMKRRTFFNVIIGSIPGALPPIGGWAAATGAVDSPVAWLLFGIVFLWQIPHVLAIAWLCNDDYTNAGFRMLPDRDENGFKTSTISLICLVALLPVVTTLFYFADTNLLFLIVSLAASLYYLFYGIQFFLERQKNQAKKLMFASFFYLPIVWLVLFLDKIFL